MSGRGRRLKVPPRVLSRTTIKNALAINCGGEAADGVGLWGGEQIRSSVLGLLLGQLNGGVSQGLDM